MYDSKLTVLAQNTRTNVEIFLIYLAKEKSALRFRYCNASAFAKKPVCTYTGCNYLLGVGAFEDKNETTARPFSEIAKSININAAGEIDHFDVDEPLQLCRNGIIVAIVFALGSGGIDVKSDSCGTRELPAHLRKAPRRNK